MISTMGVGGVGVCTVGVVQYCGGYQLITVGMFNILVGSMKNVGIQLTHYDKLCRICWDLNMKECKEILSAYKGWHFRLTQTK